MNIALLINDRESRTELAERMNARGAEVDEFPTAAKAVGMFGAKGYDLIVLHWQVHPGKKPDDPELKKLAMMIPTTIENRNVLYWEAGLRVMDCIRHEDSPNKATPLVIIFPALGESQFESGDRLMPASIESDLESRQPTEIITDRSLSRIFEELESHLISAELSQ